MYTYIYVCTCVHRKERGWKVWISVIYMCTYIYVYMYIHIHIHTDVYIHVHIYVYLHVYNIQVVDGKCGTQ